MRAFYGVGRAIFGGLFLYSGINHFRNTDSMAGYAASKGLQQPELAIRLSGAGLIAAGAGLILGIAPRLAALGALGFLAAASPTFHDFWTIEDPQQRQGEMIHFAKNAALMGAALSFAAVNPRDRDADGGCC